MGVRVEFVGEGSERIRDLTVSRVRVPAASALIAVVADQLEHRPVRAVSLSALKLYRVFIADHTHRCTCTSILIATLRSTPESFASVIVPVA